jgi:hypothetical protein
MHEHFGYSCFRLVRYVAGLLWGFSMTPDGFASALAASGAVGSGPVSDAVSAGMERGVIDTDSCLRWLRLRSEKV